MPKRILVTGGAGFVGSVLVPKLLECGHSVSVLDLFLYGDTLPDHSNLTKIRGDIRDQEVVRKAVANCDTVIHLACISNDPSFELNPDLGKSINFDAFEPLVQISRDAGVERFIYASSSSVYGIKDVENVTEDMPLEPLTDYSKFKAACEEILKRYQSPDFTTVTLRPATVCGYSPRQRMDVVVNILTNHAYHNKRIKVFGGPQKRPNIHIQDMVDAYLVVLEAPKQQVAGRVFNVGDENHSVLQLAEIVRKAVGPQGIDIEVVPTDDNRTYHISSQKIQDELGFRCHHSIEEAARDIVHALDTNILQDAMNNSLYFNIKRMQEVQLH